ncbi:MAG: hypothetical protein HY238_28615 [Acidobacteria bacterium]|nr:hypothetical protein [Acidobacteriota bacterium]
MTFAPDVETRFKRIEDALTVAAELLDRFERRTEERFQHLESTVDNLQEWRRETEINVKALIQAQLNTERSLAELSHTMNQFLKARTNGGES